MILFPNSIDSWRTPLFAETLKQEIKALDETLELLQQALRHGNYATTKNLHIMLLSTTENDTSIQVKTGIFFTGIIAGCHCADDPTPMNELNEYCELDIHINKDSSIATITLLP